jgi:hypothetical protein
MCETADILHLAVDCCMICDAVEPGRSSQKTVIFITNTIRTGMSHFTLYLKFGSILYNASSHTLPTKRTVPSHFCCVIIAIIINYYCYYSDFLEKTKCYVTNM